MTTSAAGQWAGIATLRVRALDILPGFARVETAATGWEGEFVAGGSAEGIATGAAVELLLPRDAVVRATICRTPEAGIFALTGESPWPQWKLTPPPAVRPVTRGEILEIRAPTVITADNWLRSEDLPLKREIRVLLDYRPLQEIHVPLEWFLSAGTELRGLNAKIAAVIGGQIGLGLLRAMAARDSVVSPAGFRAFSDYDEARLWLLG